MFQKPNAGSPVHCHSPEGIMVVVVGGLELHVHEIDSSDRWGEEEDFHGCVVQRDEVGEEVQVARQEHEGEQHLGAAWNEENKLITSCARHKYLTGNLKI